MELKVTSEAVIAAAGKCPQAKAVLETLFPTVFTPEDKRLPFIKSAATSVTGPYRILNAKEVTFGAHDLADFLQVRGSGNLRGRGLYLGGDGTSFDWRIEKDNEGQSVLVAYKKGDAPK